MHSTLALQTDGQTDKQTDRRKSDLNSGAPLIPVLYVTFAKILFEENQNLRHRVKF